MGHISFPKDKPVIDQEYIDELKRIVGRCEHPQGCRMRVGLDVHHVKGRGLGGGFRKDTPENLIVLCREHHQYAHTQGVKYREDLYEAMNVRLDFEKRAIRTFFRQREA